MKDVFPSYYEPSEVELKEVWQNCVFVFDANILLKLFRTPKQPREYLISVLRNVSDRLWIPYQFALEYHRNREKTITDQCGALKLEKTGFNSFKADVEKLKDHPLHDFESLLQIVKRTESELNEVLEKQSLKVEAYKADCEKIKNELAQLFTGKIGEPYLGEDFDKKIQLAIARFEKKIPPGYLDKKSNDVPESRYGDALGWLQLLDHATTKSHDSIILVTDDAKEDWWVTVGGQKRPAQRLIDEMRNTGSIFQLYSSKDFLKFSSKYLVKTANVDEIVEEMEKSDARFEVLEYDAEHSAQQQNQMDFEIFCIKLTRLCQQLGYRASHKTPQELIGLLSSTDTISGYKAAVLNGYVERYELYEYSAEDLSTLFSISMIILQNVKIPDNL